MLTTISSLSLLLVVIIFSNALLAYGESQIDQPSDAPVATYCIEGKVSIGAKNDDWISETSVIVDGGRFHGFLSQSGKFTVCDMPPGSYLVEVLSPNNMFDPVRVDISGKSGKIRARKMNVLKTKSVSHLPYPLVFKTEAPAQFFKKRETWNILSTLKNPMVLLLVAPLLLMMVLPRLMKSMGPDQQKEMQESMSTMQQGSGMPNLEDMFTNFFGGQAPAKKKAIKKR